MARLLKPKTCKNNNNNNRQTIKAIEQKKKSNTTRNYDKAHNSKNYFKKTHTTGFVAFWQCQE